MGRKTGSGQGSIFKQGNIWRGQITVNGSRKSVSGKTKKEVVGKLAELQCKYNNSSCAEQSDITLCDWYEHWFREYACNTLSYESLSRIEGMFNRYIPEDMKNERIADIDRRIIEQFYNERMHKYSRNTVQLFSAEFKRCLEAAVDEGIIDKNPHDKVKLPRTRPPKKIYAYTDADQKKFMEYYKAEGKGKKHYDILFYFLIGTGMRFGEATALTWDDVDLKTGRININKTAIKSVGGTIIKQTTKTRSGIRTIYVGENIIKELKKLHKTATSTLVFPNRYGTVMSHTAAMREWHKICDKINIPRTGLHSLRHTWATRALEAGIDIKTVSTMLGHSNVTTTMNVYQDVFDTHKMQAACTLNALYG